MARIKIPSFGGMIPALDDRLITDTSAAYAENTWLYSGALRGLPTPKLIHTLVTPTTAKIYRVPLDISDAAAMYDSTFLEFDDANTDVLRSPVFDDTYERYYWVSAGIDPKYNTKARIENGDDPWVLGVPQPAQPTLSATGGSGAADTRSYVTTWVTAYGEEGPPSTPRTVTGKVDDTWTLTPDTVATADDGGVGDDRYITLTRIYRTVVSASGVATYFLVVEQAYNAGAYDDTAADTTVTSNAQLESTSWSGPPSGLEGFIMLGNGIVAGFKDNEVWFSEPYRMHAWPAAYALTVEHPIVGLGVSNQALVVCTKGYPVTISGVNPAYMSETKLAALEPCISRGSILSAPEGVYYASANGLVLVRSGSVENITRVLITRDKWQQLTGSSALKSARFGTSYYTFGTVLPGAFQEDSFETTAFTQEDYSNAFLGVLIDPFNERVNFSILRSDDPIAGVMTDPWTGEVMLIRDGGVYWIDQEDVLVEIEPCNWKSKIFQTNQAMNFCAMKVYFEVPSVEPDDYGTVEVYADGVLRFTRTLTTSGQLMRMPSGFHASFWQIEFTTSLKILSVQMATSVAELRDM
jgi:hypothetical protein